jgi:probable HAF family extracellular repeat protein
MAWFLLSNGTFTSLDFPQSIETVPAGINDAGQIAGYYLDANNQQHGFIYSAGAWKTVDVAGAKASA